MTIAKIITFFFFFLLIVSDGYCQESRSGKIVFLTTRDSHGKGEHAHNVAATLLSERLKESLPDVKTEVYRHDFPEDSSVFVGVNTIVVLGDGGGDHFFIPRLALIDSLMKTGVGLVMVHFALEVPKDEGGRYFEDWIGGYFETDWSVNPVWTAQFKSLPRHPVTNGVQPFSIKDEWYYHMRFKNDPENIIPILQVLPPESTLNREDGTHSNNAFVREDVLEKKRPQILSWAYERENGGKGFGFTGGHFLINWKNDNFRKLVLNAIAWTANIDVPENGIETHTPADSELDNLTNR